MAESMNGSHNPDVEMKEEGLEQPVNPNQAAPPFQPEQAAQEAVVNGIDPQLNSAMSHQDAQAALPHPPVEQAAAAGASANAQPPAEPQLSAGTAPVAAPVTQVQAPVSAPTPPAMRESSRTSSLPPAGFAPPERPNAHGSPTRVYLNQHVTPHLLEGMKYLAAYEPEKPLKWLSEFLARRSAEQEGES